ncbi:hypothetical protein E5D57_000878 [Metarhizium anisopliae]|nr:hypothetical protein E5D57_000878 [Metarhizium anisopliae]
MVDFGIADSGGKGGNDANSPMKSSFDSSVQNDKGKLISYNMLTVPYGTCGTAPSPVLVATRPANDLHYSSLEEVIASGPCVLSWAQKQKWSYHP